ncbi:MULTISPECIES: hypothetical protein [unclassified Bradyrhizobium]|uniref:hypothetical protein n=1 Tax=unclassified Bradyrhizobium TaxID=2631580 RepID=UPI001FF790E5|nr:MULTISPECIES: hypothetical protein [unclassified Bradyrhizobium]MCK1721539.1 hypothetical protein [Bradyrhizobium sp. 141]UPK36639.1 hypothetical protein IVB18_04455 [Bradyrhizobium sp. 186]
MTIQSRLKEMLKTVAVALGDQLLARLVFVGGCTTALYIMDPVTLEGVRATDDVDLNVDLAGFPEWAKLLEQLRKQGFSEAVDDNVICRMKLGELKVDFMPDDEEILGFSNRWYAKGIETAVETSPDENITIRHLAPPMFIATKLEAYRGRGGGDLIGSRDAEDILLLVDGRQELVDESTSTPLWCFAQSSIRLFRSLASAGERTGSPRGRSALSATICAMKPNFPSSRPAIRSPMRSSLHPRYSQRPPALAQRAT